MFETSIKTSYVHRMDVPKLDLIQLTSRVLSLIQLRATKITCLITTISSTNIGFISEAFYFSVRMWKIIKHVLMLHIYMYVHVYILAAKRTINLLTDKLNHIR